VCGTQQAAQGEGLKLFQMSSVGFAKEQKRNQFKNTIHPLPGKFHTFKLPPTRESPIQKPWRDDWLSNALINSILPAGGQKNASEGSR
jgi:hypothetical protein